MLVKSDMSSLVLMFNVEVAGMVTLSHEWAADRNIALSSPPEGVRVQSSACTNTDDSRASAANARRRVMANEIDTHRTADRISRQVWGLNLVLSGNCESGAREI